MWWHKKRDLSDAELRVIDQVLDALHEMECTWEEEYEDSDIFYDQWWQPIAYPFDMHERQNFARHEFKNLMQRLLKVYRRIPILVRQHERHKVVSLVDKESHHFERDVNSLKQKMTDARFAHTALLLSPARLDHPVSLQELTKRVSPDLYQQVKQVVQERLRFLDTMLDRCHELRRSE